MEPVGVGRKVFGAEVVDVRGALEDAKASLSCWILGKLWGRVSFHHALTSEVP